MKRFTLFLLFMVLYAPHAIAQNTPKLNFPVDCTLGKDCWTVHYVDVNKTDEAQDFTCARKTENLHRGTDFAVRSMKEIRDGTDILAAAAGTVLRVRDGETDTIKAKEDLLAIQQAKRECGNGVLIDHTAGGYPGVTTMYCHLKKGSIAVRQKDVVTPGQRIAVMGRSGFSEYPHLHFGVIKDGKILDPFTGEDIEAGCGKEQNQIWKNNMPYEPVAIFDSGFANSAPDLKDLENGEIVSKTIEGSSKGLVFWAGIYGAQQDDEISITIQEPSGDIFAKRDIVQEKNRGRQYYYTGRRFSKKSLKPGTYRAQLTIKRKNLEPIYHRNSVIVE